MQNHFELFALPERYAIDTTQLERAYREVQSKVHPDKFVQSGEAEKRVAMQWATRANEAYQVLKKPLPRATYLCQLHGIDLQTESNTSMPVAFLMQQIEWREAFDDARAAADTAALHALEAELTTSLKTMLTALASSFDDNDFSAATEHIRACMFIEKFLQDIAALDD